MVFTYNQVNLPRTATGNGKDIAYTYDALGGKLNRKSSVGGIETQQDYIGGIEYSRSGTASPVIERIATEDGFLLNSSGTYSYYYNLTDHLGNVRSVLKKTGTATAPTATVMQKQDYYPFGKTKSIATSIDNKYLYNGKEMQADLSGGTHALGSSYVLEGQLDYGARFYDAEIGRWNVVDPLADSYHSYSPYNYALNDPIGKLDPNGMWVEIAGGWSTNDPSDIAEFMQQMQGNDQEDPPKKRGNTLANGPGSIIRKSGRSQVRNGDGSSDNFLDNAYEMGIGFTPIGTVFDIKAAISGKDMSEEQLAWGWRLAGVIPFVSEFKKGFKIISTVKNDKKLLKIAEETFEGNKQLRDEANNLISQLNNGNMNPGIGSKWVVNDIYEARSRGGARVYFKNTSNGIVEIVGYSNKANQQAVINRLIEVNKSLKK